MRVQPVPRFPSRKAAGMAIGSVVMVIALAVMFAFLMASLAIIHLQLTSREWARATAQNLADSAIAAAIAQLKQNPLYGRPGQPNAPFVATFTNTPPNAQGVVTFTPMSLPTVGAIPISTNNFNQSGPTSGAGTTTVPGYACALIGTGVCGDIVRCQRVVVMSPPFPDCLAAAGTIQSTGALVVASVNQSLPPGQLLSTGNTSPGDMVSNSTASPAVNLQGSGIHVMGDIRTCGTIALDPTADVGGAQYQHDDPLALPFVDVIGKLQDVACIPAGSNCADAPSSMSNPSLSGFNLVASGHSVDVQYPQATITNPVDCYINGDLTLNQGVLAVTGNLTVTGGVNGIGAVVCGGTLTIQGASNLQTSDRLALLSQGDMHISGKNGMNGSFFQGLVYTHGNFYASDVTLLGAFVANTNVYVPNDPTFPTNMDAPPGAADPSSTSGNVYLNNVTLLRNPGFTEVQIVAFTDNPSHMPQLDFLRSKKGFMGTGWFNNTKNGYYQPKGGQIAVTVTVQYTPPDTFTYRVQGNGPTTSINTAVSEIKNIVKNAQPSVMWPGSGKIFNSGAFDQHVKDMLRRLNQIAMASWQSQSGLQTPDINMWGTDQNEFLSPPDAMRVASWLPYSFP